MTSSAESRQPARFIEKEGTLDMCQDLTGEMDEVHQRIDLLRLATREELEKVLASTINLPDGDSIVQFFLKLFTDTRELPATKIEAAIAERNTEAKQKGGKEWKSTLHTIRSNLNDMNVTKTTNTGLKLRTRKRDDMWRWESGKVQAEHEIPEDKRASYVTSSENRHKKVLEIASRTEDKQVKCLLQLVAHQMVGIRLAEIEEVFEGTLNQTGLMELIERTNTEILAPIDAKIHRRNDIVIIGPQNPHWESAVGEPILMGDKTDSIMALARRRKAGTSAKIRNALLNKETPGQTIARLEKEISALKEALARATAEVSALTASLRAAETAPSPETIAAKTKEAVREAVQILAQRIVELTEQLNAANVQIEALTANLNAVERALQNEKALRLKAERDASRAEAARVELRRQVDPTSKTESQIVAALRDQLAATLREKNQAEERASRAESKIDGLTKQLRELQAVQISLSEAASSLRDEAKILRAHVASLEDTSRALVKSLGDQLDEAKKSAADLAAANKELQDLLESLTAPSAPQTAESAAQSPPTEAQTAASSTAISTKPSPTTEQPAAPDTTTSAAPAPSTLPAPPAATTTTLTTPSASPLSIYQPSDQAAKPAKPSQLQQSQKPPESPSNPIIELEKAKTFETSEALYNAVEKAVTYGSTLNPKGMPKGTHRRIKNAVRNLKKMPPHVEAAKTRVLGLLEGMKGQGEVIPHDEIQKFLQATL